MKILTLSNLYPPDVLGGYELACAQAVDGLRARGHEVDVLTASPRVPVPDAPRVHRRLRLTEDRYWVAHGAPEDAFLLLRDVESRLVCAHNVHALTAALGEFAPDVVYVCNVVGLGGLAMVAALGFLGVPWVWQLGDRIPYDVCFAGGRLVPALARAFSATVGGGGSYVAVSRQLADWIEGSGVRLNGPVEIAPNWVSGPRPPRAPRRDRGGPLKILSCGRVTREKGAGVLIEAAAALRDSGRDDFVIDVYGEVAEPWVSPLVRKLGLAGHVNLQGPRPHREILSLYREYDLFAFPTREHEPFGMVALEALSRGCVPVLTRRCGVAEWLVHGVHCLKAAPDPLAFADAFARVMDGATDLGPIARRGEEAVWRDFHADAVLPRIEACLTRAARQPRRPAGTAAEAYRLARLAESLAREFVREARRA